MSTEQLLFNCFIILQFFAVAIHDLVNIPGLAHGKQVQAVIGRRKLWVATLVNSTFPGIAVFFGVRFWNHAAPRFATNYWIIYCAITVSSAALMW